MTDARSTASTKKNAEKKGPKQARGNKQMWKLLSRLSATVAAIAATQATALAWRALSGHRPPTSPADPDLRAREAIAWAILAGSIAELSKVAANRAAVRYWVNSTGQLPPGVKRNKV